MVFGFNKRIDADTLLQVSRERRSRVQVKSGQQPYNTMYPNTPGYGAGVTLPAPKHGTLRAFVAFPASGGSTGARMVGNTIILGTGQAVLWRRDVDSASGRAIKAQRSLSTNNMVHIPVYNLCPEPVRSHLMAASGSGDPPVDDYLLFIIQDVWGDFYVIKICQFPSVSSLSSVSSVSSISSISSISSVSESISSISSISSVSVCNYTGTVVIGKGDLHRMGNSLCETQQELTFRDGKLCSVRELGVVCQDVCNCSSISSLSSFSSESSESSS